MHNTSTFPHWQESYRIRLCSARRNDLPELGADLVAALAGLDVDEFTHLEGVVVGCGGDCSFAKLQVLMLVVMVLEVGAASLAYNCPGCYRGSKKSKSFCRAVAQSTYIYVHNLHVLYAVFVFAFFLHLT